MIFRGSSKTDALMHVGKEFRRISQPLSHDNASLMVAFTRISRDPVGIHIETSRPTTSAMGILFRA